LPPEDELAMLLGEVENLAKNSGTYLIDVSPSGTKEEELLKTYILKIDCEGQMDQIFRFMHSLENSKKLLRIDAIRLKPKEAGSSIINCNLFVSKIVMPE